MSKRDSTILSTKLYKLTIGGGVAFWAANFAISRTPIAAEYRSAFSISYLPMALVEALLRTPLYWATSSGIECML